MNVLKACTQAVLAPAAIALKLMLAHVLQYKDVNGTDCSCIISSIDANRSPGKLTLYHAQDRGKLKSMCDRKRYYCRLSVPVTVKSRCELDRLLWEYVFVQVISGLTCLFRLQFLTDYHSPHEKRNQVIPTFFKFNLIRFSATKYSFCLSRICEPEFWRVSSFQRASRSILWHCRMQLGLSCTRGEGWSCSLHGVVERIQRTFFSTIDYIETHRAITQTDE